jgi:hypothetical protein
MANANQTKSTNTTTTSTPTPTVQSSQTATKSTYSTVAPTAEPTPKMSDDDKIREFITLLYSKYTGKAGDPASVQFLFKNIKDKTYSLTQAGNFLEDLTFRRIFCQV